LNSPRLILNQDSKVHQTYRVSPKILKVSMKYSRLVALQMQVRQIWGGHQLQEVT